MKALPRPPFGVDYVIRANSNSAAAAPIRATSQQLCAIEQKYLAAAETGTLWTISSPIDNLSEDDRDVIHGAYVTQLRSKTSEGRAAYDYLRIMASGGICPNCLARDAAALDHYLPRRKFKAFALQPTNLIPMCTGCNTAKRETVATSAEDQFLHSYFDDLGATPWLAATVVERQGGPLKFQVERSPEWSDTLYQRVLTHFQRFNLAELYGIKASALLGNLRGSLRTFWEEAVEDQRGQVVARELLRQADSYAQNGSIWQSAAFKAWASSAWFCESGWTVSTDSAMQAAAFERLNLCAVVDEGDLPDDVESVLD